jgi:hypothetical protein
MYTKSKEPKRCEDEAHNLAESVPDANAGASSRLSR